MQPCRCYWKAAKGRRLSCVTCSNNFSTTLRRALDSFVAAVYDFEKKQFICPEGSQESTHMVEFDHRVKSGNLFYQAWYNQGLRAIDISNPFRPCRWAITSRPIQHQGGRGVVTRASLIRTGTRI